MAETVTLHGCVLSVAPIGEADRRLVLLTREMGEISCFARGAGKPQSALGAAASLFVFGTFEGFMGRSSVTIVRATVSARFTELARDLDSMVTASYFAEIAEYNGTAGVDETERIDLLYVALHALVQKAVPPRLIRRIYEMRTYRINGEYPEVFSCMHCGKKEDLTVFSVRDRGVLCSGCASSVAGGSTTAGPAGAAPQRLPAGMYPVTPAVLYTFQYIYSAPVEKLFAFTLKEPSSSMFERIAGAYVSYYKEHVYHSEKMLP